MAWVRIDDGFPDHPKIAQAGPLAMAMQVAALCYANRHLTDGFLPMRAVASFMPLVAFDPETGQAMNWRDVAQSLVDSGVWIETEGGYQIHDYHDYQPTREQVLKEREAARKRMADARARKRGENDNVSSEEVRANCGGTSDNPTPVPNPVPTPNTQGIKDHRVEPAGPTRRKTPEFGPGDTAYELAVHLRTAILNRDPTTKVPEETPAGLARWAKAADLMIRRDGRDPQEAARLITWAQQDPFWCANVLSMDKFRKQYDRLKLQARRVPASRGDPDDDPIARRRRMLAVAQGGVHA